MTQGTSIFGSEDDIATVSSDDEFVSESVFFLDSRFATNMTPGASLSGSDDVFVLESFISSGSGAVIIGRPGASTTGSDDNTDKPAGTPDSIVTVLNSDSVTGIIRSKIVLMIFTKRFFSVRLKGTSDSFQASGAVTQTTKSAGASAVGSDDDFIIVSDPNSDSNYSTGCTGSDDDTVTDLTSLLSVNQGTSTGSGDDEDKVRF